MTREWWIPIASPILSENQRQHHMTKATFVKAMRTEACIRARQYHVPNLDFRCELVLFVIPPDNRRRDQDNLIPTLKALADGLTDAGVFRDDTPKFVRKLMPVICKPDSSIDTVQLRLVVCELDDPLEPVPTIDLNRVGLVS